ncbi:MAG: T9SS type A sorting domain-containing protein [Bacteroidia bacterium]|nr:T9SS type A sorting domain-containing protein [Bacteroidia bacterium]
MFAFLVPLRNKFIDLYVFLATAFFVFPIAILSQWNSNVSLNTPVSTALNDQQNVRIAEDGNGGAIVVWEDYRNNPLSADIYIQRFNKNGVAQWGANGKPLCIHSAHQSNPNINYRNGKAVIIWNDFRSGNVDIYAQMIDTSGNVLWATNGNPVVTNSLTQNDGKVALNSNGESYVVFQDSSAGNWNIMAQKLSSSGTRLWGSTGTVVCNAGYDQKNPRLEMASSGGIYVVWQDRRNGANHDIYCQKLNDQGTRLWNPGGNGYWICSAPGTQTNPKIELFGAGFVVVWQDNRNALDYDIYIQYINDNGMAQWGTNGVPVCNATGNQSAHDLQTNGNLAFVVWKDYRAVTNTDIYFQIFNTNGTALLQANGKPLSTGSFDQINPNIDVDAGGNAYIVWQDSTAQGWNISGAKINAAGNILWNVPVCTAANTQADPKNVHDENGGMIVAWQDRRNEAVSARDIYIQKIFSSGSPDGLHEWSTRELKAKIFPNPGNGCFYLESDVSLLPLTLEVYTTSGKIIGKETVSCPMYHCGFPLSTGFYFIRIITANNQNFTVKWASK